MKALRRRAAVMILTPFVLLVGCDGGAQGKVEIDGSSTVFPIMQAAAEMYMAEHPEVRVTVGRSGTGAGFKKLLADQPELRVDITGASRCIKAAEVASAADLGVDFIEIPVAYDGIAVVVHPSNDFVDYLTTEELKRIWEPGSTISNWQDVRPGFPDLALKLYGPTGDSGTYEYFTHAINGEARACRTDYAPSATIQVVQGVAGDPGSLGFFGYSYYVASADRLKLVAIRQGDGEAILPSPETISSRTYTPLARPLMIYVNQASLEQPAVVGFVEFFFNNARKIVEHETVNYIALQPEMYTFLQKRFAQRTTGTVFASIEDEARPLQELYGIN